MNKLSKKIFIVVFLCSIIGSVQAENLIGSSNPLKLIIAIDVSKSVRPHWPAIQEAIMTLIDELNPMDIVYPLSFGTYCTILDNPIEICDGRQKFKLREIFSSLKPDQDWTYFLELLKTAQQINVRAGGRTILFVVSDLESSPGPGRTSDVDLENIADDEKIFNGGGIFLIRLIPQNKMNDTAILERLRAEEKAFLNGGVFSTVTENKALVHLIQELIPLLKNNIETAKSYMAKESLTQKKSSSGIEKIRPVLAGEKSEGVEEKTKGVQSEPSSTIKESKRFSWLIEKTSKIFSRIKEPFRIKKDSASQRIPLFCFFAFLALAVASIPFFFRKKNHKISHFYFEIKGDELGNREIPLHLAENGIKTFGPRGDILVISEELNLSPIVFRIALKKGKLWVTPTESISLNNKPITQKTIFNWDDTITLKEKIGIFIKKGGEENDT